MPDSIAPLNETTVTSDVATLPSEENAPQTPETPAHHETLNNLSRDGELTGAVRRWASTQIEHFRTQPAREKMMETGGTMDIADRMMRVSLNRTGASGQNEDTRSNVTSTVFKRAIDTVFAGTAMVFFGDDNSLPAQYEPEINVPDYDPTAAKIQVNQQNAQEQFTWDEDKRVQKCKDALWRLFKYGNAVVSLEWQRRVDTRKERVAVAWDANGRPTAYEFKEREKVVCDWPVFNTYPLEDCYFDAQIDDENKWRCFAVESQMPYEELAGDATVDNLGKVKPSHFYVGEVDGESVKADRSDNAGEEQTPEPTGLLRVWHVIGFMPIKESKRPGRGKWDATQMPARYWATFVGDIKSDNAVCVRLIKNPYHHGKMWFKLIHSHRDDNGAYHAGDATFLQSLYYQATTNLNQAFDCVNTIIRAPWYHDGPINTRDLKFNRAGKVIQVGRGTTLQQLPVQNTTGITLPMNDRIEDDIFKTAGADKPVRGEAFLSRTSALEANNALQQALVVIDNQTSYIADQLFGWMLDLDAQLWRQYGDPEMVYSVTQGNEYATFEPAKLTVDYKVKVTAVSRYRNNILKRREINQFIMSGGYAFAEKSMDEQGKREFWIDVFKTFGFERPARYFPTGAGYDANMRAIQATHAMLNIGAWVEPNPNENHRAWLSVMEPLADQYERLPQNEVNPDRLRMIRAHIEMRKAFEKSNYAQQQALNRGGAEMPEGGMGQLPGRAGGEVAEAMEGAYGEGA